MALRWRRKGARCRAACSSESRGFVVWSVSLWPWGCSRLCACSLFVSCQAAAVLEWRSFSQSDENAFSPGAEQAARRRFAAFAGASEEQTPQAHRAASPGPSALGLRVLCPPARPSARRREQRTTGTGDVGGVSDAFRVSASRSKSNLDPVRGLCPQNQLQNRSFSAAAPRMTALSFLTQTPAHLSPSVEAAPARLYLGTGQREGSSDLTWA